MSKDEDCKRILCIRADNMGDVIMSSPAIRALKSKFGCELGLLTSSMGKPITPFIEGIDKVFVSDLPWMQNDCRFQASDFQALIAVLKKENFDAAVIFTVYSQSSLPSAMLCYFAGIPVRVAYSRENPYSLLTHWLPDKEPYQYIKHQVQRDLDLVAHIGATDDNHFLSLRIKDSAALHAITKLESLGINTSQPWLIFHPGVSEKKREYPEELWMQAAMLAREKFDAQILISGSSKEKMVAERIQKSAGSKVFSIAGLLNVEEMIATIRRAAVVVSVNTSIIHIAAAEQVPVVVLYALTNPQHTPWMCPHSVLPFSVAEELKSKNEVIRYVDRTLFQQQLNYPRPEAVLEEVEKLLAQRLLKKTN